MLLKIGEAYFNADAESVIDVSIPVQFSAPQLQAFGAPSATAQAYRAGEFVGDVRQGGSCNCASLHFTPHCNGTHTESVGHLTADAWPVRPLARGLYLAQLITVTPIANNSIANNNDAIIDRTLLKTALQTTFACNALIVRTLPNASDKLTRNYDQQTPAYFTPDALAWLAEIGIEHLLVDLPSVDRMHDGGQLLAHRAFWGLPLGSHNLYAAQRPLATITELIYVPDHVLDGRYLLNLNIAPFDSDAASSRPLLYPLQQ